MLPSLIVRVLPAIFLAAVAGLLSSSPVSAATLVVNTAVDENGSNPSACSLREAISAVNAGTNGTGGCVATLESGGYGANDQITFAASLNGVPILLTNGVLGILQSVQMTGNGPMHTIIDGQKGTPSATGVLQVNLGFTVGITGLTIRNGSAGFFGGIFNLGTVTVTNSALTGNSASTGGGISNQGTLTITNSTLSDNSASDFGGSIYNDNGGTLTITNSTLSGNSALLAGGIFNQGTVTVAHSTLSGNSANTSGGIFNQGTVNLRASVLDSGASGANCSVGVASLGSNVADDTSCGLTGVGDQQVADGAILLGVLADNGGPTKTHILLGSSPAIDAVQGACTNTGSVGGAPVSTDQRGRPRPVGLRCDAGAVELSPGVLSFSAPTFAVAEGDGSANIVITRTGGTEGSVGATVTVTNGTANSPGDYTAATPTVTFADGDGASKAVTITIIDDTLKEPNETVLLTLGSPTGSATIGARASAVLTIFDDDQLPSVSIANLSLNEVNAGQTSTANFTAYLSGPSSQQITVAYATADGSAKAGADYTATSGTLTFAPNESTKTITVPIIGDTLAEADETFTVTLSNPTNATLGVFLAIGTIQNDDLTVACGPRPRVTQTLAAGGGALAVHIESSPLNTSSNNPIQSIRFGTFQNATVTLNGQSITSGQTFTLPPNTHGADFTVRRVTPGQATTVPFTVSDSCGSWDTFVGGGANAGF